ncbi:hypothetical protein [Bradymonas sediminis]|nr:hypothetical protein [Bradymonas sediminis]
MMDFIAAQLFFGGILPALVMGIALLIGALIAGKEDRSDDAPPGVRPWAAASGFGLAFGAGFLALVGAPDFLPGNAMHWLFYMALVAVGVGVIEGIRHTNDGLRAALRLGLALLTFRLTLGFMVEHHWDGASAWIWLGGLTLGSNALMNALDRAAQERPGAMVPLAMTLMSAGGAAVLVLTGSARVGQLMGVMTAAATATLVVAWLRPGLRVSRGGSTVFGLLFSALLAYGYFTSADVPAFADALNHPQTLATLLVAASPLMLWVSGQNPIKRMTSWRAALASAALVATPLAAGLLVAANQSDPPAAAYHHEASSADAPAE